MPFDSRPEIPIVVKPSPSFTMVDLVDWLETKPPDTTYSYVDAKNCLLTRWHVERGVCLNFHSVFDRPYPSGIDTRSALGKFNPLVGVAISAPFTYGAALKRARACLPWRIRLSRWWNR